MSKRAAIFIFGHILLLNYCLAQNVPFQPASCNRQNINANLPNTIQNQSPFTGNSGSPNFINPSANVVPVKPVLTEVVPDLQLCDVSLSGDLPIGGTVKVCGCFPIYAMINVEGSVPSTGTATVSQGNGLNNGPVNRY